MLCDGGSEILALVRLYLLPLGYPSMQSACSRLQPAGGKHGASPLLSAPMERKKKKAFQICSRLPLHGISSGPLSARWVIFFFLTYLRDLGPKEKGDKRRKKETRKFQLTA
jgi:hypothetical protein